MRIILAGEGSGGTGGEKESGTFLQAKAAAARAGRGSAAHSCRRRQLRHGRGDKVRHILAGGGSGGAGAEKGSGGTGGMMGDVVQEEEILQQDGDLSRSQRRKAAAAQVRGWRMWYSRRKSCSRTGISAEANLSAGRRSQQEPISQQDGMGGGSGGRGGTVGRDGGGGWGGGWGGAGAGRGWPWPF